MVFYFMAGTSLLIVVFVPNVTANGTDLTPLQLFLTMFGKWAITAAFNATILFTTEVFPTNARNTGFGLCTFIAKIGAMIAPFSVTLALKIPWLPGVIFAVVALVSAFVVLFLPETQNRPLPETVEELELWDHEQ